MFGAVCNTVRRVHRVNFSGNSEKLRSNANNPPINGPWSSCHLKKYENIFSYEIQILLTRSASQFLLAPWLLWVRNVHSVNFTQPPFRPMNLRQTLSDVSDVDHNINSIYLANLLEAPWYSLCLDDYCNRPFTSSSPLVASKEYLKSVLRFFFCLPAVRGIFFVDFLSLFNY